MLDRSEVTLLDYEYLTLIHNPSSVKRVYEISLPLDRFPHFMEEFYGTLLEYDVNVLPSIDFDTVYTEFIVKQKMLQSIKDYETDELVNTREMKSIAFIEVPIDENESVIDDYKKFLDLFVLEQKTNEELDQMEIEKIKQNLFATTNV